MTRRKGEHLPRLPRRARKGLLEEATAVLRGCAADRVAAVGELVPWPVWVNALAHRAPERMSELRPLAATQPEAVPVHAALQIARELRLLAAEDVVAIQTDLLVPVELELLAGRQLPGGPAQVVQAVRRRLPPRQPGG